MPNVTSTISLPVASSDRLTGLLLLALGLLAAARAEEGGEVRLEVPPASLGQWYRPQAERNLWLHNMFALRRALQAVEEYAAQGDRPHMEKWLARLQRHYRKIGEMVPEWRDELELELLARIERAPLDQVAGLAAKLRRSCEGCHREYRLSAALRYRAPAFDADDPAMGRRAMQRLARELNRIKIGAEDHRPQSALEALGRLRQGLAELGAGCKACHGRDRQPRQRILGAAAEEALDQVEAGLRQDDGRRVGRYLGEFAVTACARCHAIHRPLSELHRLLSRP